MLKSTPSVIKPLFKAKDKTAGRCWRSLTEKKQILDLVDEGKTYQWITEHLGVPRSTISNICRIRPKILMELQEGRRQSKKKVHEANHPDVERATYCWLLQQQILRASLSFENLRDKGRFFHEQLCEKEDCSFIGTYGWSKGFRERHSIGTLVFAEKSPVRQNLAVEAFRDELSRWIEALNLSLEQVYCVEEIPLYWKKLPGFQDSSKELISFITCSNVMGTNRLPLQIISRTSKPLSVHNPWSPAEVIYCSETGSSWNSLNLRQDWFKRIFIPSMEIFSKKRKILPQALLIMSATINEVDELTNETIKVLQIPTVIADTCQPLNHTKITSFLRTFYRKEALERLMTHEENCIKPISSLKISDAAEILTESWNSLENEAIFEAWSQILTIEMTQSDAPYELQVIEKLLNLLKVIGDGRSNESLTNWIHSADDLSKNLLTDKEIIEIVREENRLVEFNERIEVLNEDQLILEGFENTEVVEVTAGELIEEEEEEIIEEVLEVDSPQEVTVFYDEAKEVEEGDSKEHQVLEAFNILVGHFKNSKDLTKMEALKQWRNQFLGQIKSD